MIKPEEIELLERMGWTVECESPFEIRSFDGSFATGTAAFMILDSLINEAKDAYEILQQNISDAISLFEGENKKLVSCFLVIHNPDVQEGQLLELSPEKYEFIPSSAQILDPNQLVKITRLDYIIYNEDDNNDIDD